MKKKVFTVAIALTLVGSISLTSCIGSFGLSNKLYSWNNTIGNKWVNELVFIAMWILPVYELCVFADVVVVNSIEFWTGSNPLAAGTVKEVQGENGLYTVETTENGYNITNEQGKEMSLIYDEESNIWSSVNDQDSVKLIKIEDENAIVYMPNGEEKQVELSANGVVAFRQAIESSTYFAAK